MRVYSLRWFVTCKSVDLGRIVCQEMGFEKLISIKPTSNVNDLKLDLYMPVMNQPFDCSSKDGFILDGWISFMLHKAINRGGSAEDTDWMGIRIQIIWARYGYNTLNWPS